MKDKLVKLGEEITKLDNQKGIVEDALSELLKEVPVFTLEEIQSAKELMRVIPNCATKVLFFYKLINLEKELGRLLK
jgi:hypothetical protein